MDKGKEIDNLMWHATDHHAVIKTTDGKTIKCFVDEYEGRGDCDREDGAFSSIMVSLDDDDMGLVLWEDEIEDIEIIPDEGDSDSE